MSLMMSVAVVFMQEAERRDLGTYHTASSSSSISPIMTAAYVPPAATLHVAATTTPSAAAGPADLDVSATSSRWCGRRRGI